MHDSDQLDEARAKFHHWHEASRVRVVLNEHGHIEVFGQVGERLLHVSGPDGSRVKGVSTEFSHLPEPPSETSTVLVLDGQVVDAFPGWGYGVDFLDVHYPRSLYHWGKVESPLGRARNWLSLRSKTNNKQVVLAEFPISR